MKIDTSVKFNMSFGSLLPGDPFIHGGYLYIKTTNISFNAVCLSNGNSCSFSPETIIWPANVVIVSEQEKK